MRRYLGQGRQRQMTPIVSTAASTRLWCFAAESSRTNAVTMGRRYDTSVTRFMRFTARCFASRRSARPRRCGYNNKVAPINQSGKVCSNTEWYPVACDCSKCFTLHPSNIAIYSNAILTFLGSMQPCCNYQDYSFTYPPLSTARCSFIQ